MKKHIILTVIVTFFSLIDICNAATPPATADSTFPTPTITGVSSSVAGQVIVNYTGDYSKYPKYPASVQFTLTSVPVTYTVVCAASPGQCVIANLLPNTSYTFQIIATSTTQGSTDKTTSTASESIKPLGTISPNVQKVSQADANNDFTGDRFFAPIDFIARLNDGKDTVCIPAGTYLRGLSVESATGINAVLITQKPWGHLLQTDTQFKKYLNKCSEKGSLEATVVAETNPELTISKENVDHITWHREGLTYGMLVVPYKYHLAGAKDLTGESSIGTYIGYKQDFISDFSLTIAPFAGLSTVPVTQSNATAGTSSTTNVAAFSYGLGFIGEIKHKVQFGLVFGADRTGSDSGYKDDGKGWVALAVGYSFSN